MNEVTIVATIKTDTKKSVELMAWLITQGFEVDLK
jgi:hypothetical protein